MSQIAVLLDQPKKHWARKVLFQVHLWLGVVLGAFIAVVCVSGGIVVFRVEMNRLTTPGTAYVVAPAAHRLSLDQMVAAVLTNRPTDTLHNVSMEAGPDVAWNFRTASKEGHRIHNFVDQYRGVVTGVDDYKSKFLQWMWDLHANLLGGKTGRLINGCLALATLVVSLSGLVIWWPGRKQWRAGFTYLFKGGWKRQNYDLHKIVGFYSFALLAFVSFTGAYFSFPDAFEVAVARLARVTHAGAPDKCGEDGPPAKTLIKDRTIPYEEYLTTAERAMPGYKAVFMSFPFYDGMSVGVKLKGNNDWHRVGLSDVYLEPATGAVISVDAFSENNAATKFLKLMLPFHFGRFGERLGLGAVGLYAVMILYVLVGLAVGVLAVTGLLMYWNRYLSKKVVRWLKPTDETRRIGEHRPHPGAVVENPRG